MDSFRSAIALSRLLYSDRSAVFATRFRIACSQTVVAQQDQSPASTFESAGFAASVGRERRPAGVVVRSSGSRL
jgi:hypothetical protein